jgi:RNA 2',3'-cyclic 3'-phosphodiesterase
VGPAPLEEVKVNSLNQRVRAFFGLPLPEEHRAELGGYLAECVAFAPDFRWVPPANLHLTVRFIGSIERQLVDEIADGLAQASLRGFDLELGELGTFKRGRLVRVVWLALAGGSEPARILAAQVEAACVQAGLEAEKRPFQPHLTVARARARFGAALPSLQPAPRLGPWTADELVLYQSHLSPKGSVYEPLRRLPLSV